MPKASTRPSGRRCAISPAPTAFPIRPAPSPAISATKGTISQTVKALERKGLLSKAVREGEKRSVALILTAKGEGALSRDPWQGLASDAKSLGNKTRRRLAKGLRSLLAQELERGRRPSFGLCATCRFFHEKGREADTRGPHFCMLLEEPLSPLDSTRICVEHVFHQPSP